MKILKKIKSLFLLSFANFLYYFAIISWKVLKPFYLIVDEYKKQKAIKEAKKKYNENHRKTFVLKVNKKYIVCNKEQIKPILLRYKKDFRYLDKICIFSIDTFTEKYFD